MVMRIVMPKYQNELLGNADFMPKSCGSHGRLVVEIVLWASGGSRFWAAKQLKRIQPAT